MSGRKWTPKPWKVGYGGRPEDGYATITSPHRKTPLTEMTVSVDIDGDELCANANLMIASPDMYEALEVAEEISEKRDEIVRLLGQPQRSNNDEIKLHGELDILMDRFAELRRSAMAKARGEA